MRDPYANRDNHFSSAGFTLAPTLSLGASCCKTSRSSTSRQYVQQRRSKPAPERCDQRPPTEPLDLEPSPSSPSVGRSASPALPASVPYNGEGSQRQQCFFLTPRMYVVFRHDTPETAVSSLNFQGLFIFSRQLRTSNSLELFRT